MPTTAAPAATAYSFDLLIPDNKTDQIDRADAELFRDDLARHLAGKPIKFGLPPGPDFDTAQAELCSSYGACGVTPEEATASAALEAAIAAHLDSTRSIGFQIDDVAYGDVGIYTNASLWQVSDAASGSDLDDLVIIRVQINCSLTCQFLLDGEVELVPDVTLIIVLSGYRAQGF